MREHSSMTKVHLAFGDDRSYVVNSVVFLLVTSVSGVGVSCRNLYSFVVNLL